MSQPITTLCSYPRTNGTGCKGIPVHGKKLCYFHQRDFDRRRRMDANLAHRTSMLANDKPGMLMTQLPDGTYFDENSAILFHDLQLPNLEDPCAIQSSLTMLLRAIATGQVQERRAGLMAYVLQIASGNVSRLNTPYRNTEVYCEADPEPITNSEIPEHCPQTASTPTSEELKEMLCEK